MSFSVKLAVSMRATAIVSEDCRRVSV